jgi:hypothetical protein
MKKKMTNKKLDTTIKKKINVHRNIHQKAASSGKKNDHHSERISIQLLVSRIFRFVGGYFLEKKKSEIENIVCGNLFRRRTK